MHTFDSSQLDQSTHLDKFFHHVFRHKKIPFAAIRTIKNYEINLRHFSRHLGRIATIADLTDDNVQAAMVEMKQAGRSAFTCNKFRDCIVAIWNFLAKKHLVKEWPNVHPMPEPRRAPIAWMPDQLKTLWRAIDAQPGYIGSVPASLWWHGLHAMLWDTGERIGAMMLLEPSEVNLDSGWVRFRAEIRKGKSADASFKMHPDTVEVVKRVILLSHNTTRVFFFPFGETYLWTLYTRILRRAKLPCGRSHKFHCIRKSVASYFEDAGGDAQKLLGHDRRKTTEAYLDPRIVTQKHACDMLFRIDRDNGKKKSPTPLDSVSSYGNNASVK